MGESYNCKDNPDYMLKLYPLGRTMLAQKEYERSKEAYTLGIHTPVPKELVKAHDDRMGIVFRRIQGKKSFAKAVGEDPSRTTEQTQMRQVPIVVGKESWFIDIGEFGYGNPLFDHGIFMSVTKYTAEDMIRKLYHMDKGTAVRFWEAFLREYYGADRPLKVIEEEIKPYAAIRALFVQHEIGRLPPERQELVKCIIG